MKPGEELTFFDFFDAIPDVLGLQDTERRVLLYNEAGYRYLGMTPEEVQGKRCFELIGRNEPCPICATEEAVAKGIPTSLVKHVPENGTWLNVRAYPIRNSDGEVYRVIEHIRDITESKILQLELERLNEKLEIEVAARTEELSNSIEELTSTRDRLIETEKLSALGRMVAGISHEVNTPLGVAITSASFIKQRMIEAGFVIDDENGARPRTPSSDALPDDFMESLADACSLVNRNLERAGNLMSGFKRIAADQTSEQLRSIDPVNYTEDLVLSMAHEIRRGKLEVEIKGERNIPFLSYPGALSQVLSNLVMNTLRHAYPENAPGYASIEISNNSVNGNGDPSSAKSGLTIIYSDRGCGMDSETLRRIYEPFYTTSIGSGSIGLGMNIVYNLVLGKLNGTIHAESRPGQGSRFIIELPVVEAGGDGATP